MGSAPFPVGFVALVTSAYGKFRVVLPNKTLGLCNFSIRVWIWAKVSNFRVIIVNVVRSVVSSTVKFNLLM